MKITHRPQVVRIGDHTWSTLILDTGTLQGCVFSPVSFTLFTHHCSATYPTNIVVKFADDTTVVGLISANPLHRRDPASDRMCSDNNLVLNTSKR